MEFWIDIVSCCCKVKETTGLTGLGVLGVLFHLAPPNGLCLLCLNISQNDYLLSKLIDFNLIQMLNQTNTRATDVNQDNPEQAGVQGHSNSGSLHSAQFPEVSWLVDACFLWSDSKIWCQSHYDPSSASLPRAVCGLQWAIQNVFPTCVWKETHLWRNWYLLLDKCQVNIYLCNKTIWV